MTALRDAISKATSDRKVTADEWNTLIKPQADLAPKEASADAREVVQLWASDSFELDAGARSAARSFLQSRGYEVPTARPAGSTEDVARALIDSNVTETDDAFADLRARAGTLGREVSVAILDSGFDTGHDGLDTRLWTNEGELAGDGLDNDANGKIDDVHGWDFAAGDADPNSSESGGHATHVTGIATRGTDDVNAIALRVFSPLSGEKIAQAIDYAAQNGARVMNMSFRVDNEADKKAIVDAIRRHPEVLFVKSAGNDGRDLNGYKLDTYLARSQLPNLAIVSAADADGTRADYSNYGTPYATHGARGSDVMSSVPGDRYAMMSGTSMASPNVVAVASKMLLMDGALRPEQLQSMLADTTDAREDWSKLTNSGGLVNATRATQLAGLTGLVRQGIDVSAAADRLGLTGAERERLVARVPDYVS